MSVPKILVLIVALTLALFGYRYWSATHNERLSQPVQTNSPQVIEKNTSDAATEPVNEKAGSMTDNEPGCLTIKQFEEHPSVLQDAARLGPLLASGEVLNPYASFDMDTLQNFAEQGDSAAMTVIGAQAVMRAFNIEESRAVDWLNGVETINQLGSYREMLAPEASLELNEAAYWFYQSALHGRLFALQHYGTVRGKLFGGAVGLGWVSREEFAAMTSREKMALAPENLYWKVAVDIAPELQTGVFVQALEAVPETELQRQVRAAIANEFNVTLVESGLPAIEVAEADSEDLVGLFDQVCASERQEELRRRSLD